MTADCASSTPIDIPSRRRGGETGVTPSETLVVAVRRSSSGLDEEFTVRRFAQMKVLDLLTSIQSTGDPSIAFRYSCRVAMCGTCALRVNGHAVLACQTSVPSQAERVWLAPLAGFPVVRDLVVDMRPFFNNWASIIPYLVPDPDVSTPAQVRPDSTERTTIDPSLDCISCGICYSTCSVSSSKRDFVGPAALNRAMTLIADSRDTLTAERLRRVSSVDGVDRCHYISACSSYCPKNLDPFAAIVRLRDWRLSGPPRSAHPSRNRRFGKLQFWKSSPRYADVDFH
jgi:succinate dehydrogenase/fumarate reductase iron-sulfur protein